MKIKKTPEEKQQARNIANAERIAREERLKGCMIADYKYGGHVIQIICEPGESDFLTLRFSDVAVFHPSEFGGDKGWVQTSMALSVDTLALLVVALSAQLREKVKELNQSIEEIKCYPVKSLPPAP